MKVRETHDVADVIENADVLYVTRVQKERFSDPAQYEEVKDCYRITPEIMQRAKQKMALMHPLPRVGEIDPAVDSDPRATYFRQVKNGMYVRMALLAAVMGKSVNADGRRRRGMDRSFVEKLTDAVERNDSLLCVGLDPDLDRLAAEYGHMSSVGERLVAFCRNIIGQTADLVCCYKPNIAFFEQAGARGMDRVAGGDCCSS